MSMKSAFTQVMTSDRLHSREPRSLALCYDTPKGKESQHKVVIVDITSLKTRE